MKKHIYIALLCLSSIAYSQEQNTTLNATIVFGHGPDCRGYSGICSFQSISNKKAEANTQISFNRESNKLTFIVLIKDTVTKLKITNNELEKGFYLYNFEEDFVLPREILNNLGITNATKIKKGNYLVKEEDDKLIMKLKLN